jgi:transcriptional regulator with XRE-family HTH domain
MPTLREMRLDLGWTVSKLADEAGVTRQVISNAEKGDSIRADTAKAIADTLSKAYGREIKSYQIDELNIL